MTHAVPAGPAAIASASVAQDRTELEDWLSAGPYALAKEAKQQFFLPRLCALTQHHYERCADYRKIVDRVFGGPHACQFARIEDAPYVPVSLFKTRELRSIDAHDVQKVLTSSGTTGQQVSRIYLDKATAQLQSSVLIKITQHFLGKQRLPMVIVDHPGVIKNRDSFSARGAGILGMSQFGRQPCYALRDDMTLDLDGLSQYLAGFPDQPVLLFGFTFMVWQFLVRALQEQGQRLDLRQATLVHSGGWKKLQDQAVDAATFRNAVQATTGIPRVLNFYGMVEQVGSVFYENEARHLQTPLMADVIVRDPVTLAPLPYGQRGVIQVLSLCPRSYPGHSLLTEDLGTIVGEDLPEHGVYGRYFDVHGRIPKAEVRGCSDTFQAAPAPPGTTASPAATPTATTPPLARAA